MKDYYLQEGFNITILMLNNANYNKKFQEKIQIQMNEEKVQKAFKFFKINIRNIDVRVFDNIWRV